MLNFFHFLSLYVDFNCSRVVCEHDCKNSTTANFHDSLDSYQRSLKICCDISCRDHCIHSDGTIHPHNGEWFSEDDPCVSFVCDYGNIRPVISMCRPPSCPDEYHFIPTGECCPVCDSTWANFCSEDEECDIACQFGFLRDEKRDCDLCRCSKNKIEITTKSESWPSDVSKTIEITPSSPTQRDVTHDDSVVRVNKNIWPIDVTLQLNIIIIFACASVILVACLLGFFWWCVHQRAYKPVPLMNGSMSSSGSTA